jgi:hypothetical protein
VHIREIELTVFYLASSVRRQFILQEDEHFIVFPSWAVEDPEVLPQPPLPLGP